MKNVILSILESKIDKNTYMHFYLIYEDNVIATGDIAYPYTDIAYLAAGFVKKEHRGKGLWKQLYQARYDWIIKNCPVKSVRLFVDEKNPMKKVYERYGYSTYKEKGKRKLSRTPDGNLWMYKKVKALI